MATPFPYNPGALYQIAPTITSTTFDLSTVTGAEIDVADGEGPREVKTFTASIGTATQSGDTWSLPVTYTLATGDLDVAGTWVGEVRLAAPGGEIVSERFTFSVRRPIGT